MSGLRVLGMVEAVLSGHVALGDSDSAIESCSCGLVGDYDDEGPVDYDSHNYAMGPDLRWHVDHVAERITAALTEQVAQREREAARKALEAAAVAIEALPEFSQTPGYEALYRKGTQHAAELVRGLKGKP